MLGDANPAPQFQQCWGQLEVMALAAKPDALSSIPGTHDGRGELTREGCPLTSTCLLKHTRVATPKKKEMQFKTYAVRSRWIFIQERESFLVTKKHQVSFSTITHGCKDGSG